MSSTGADERYRRSAQVPLRFGHLGLKRFDKRPILRFLERFTGYSRQQLTRLGKRWSEERTLYERSRAPLSRPSGAWFCVGLVLVGALLRALCAREMRLCGFFAGCDADICSKLCHNAQRRQSAGRVRMGPVLTGQSCRGPIRGLRAVA